MNIYQQFDKDVTEYLNSKLPDVPAHTAMEISAYISQKVGILIMDERREYEREYRRVMTMGRKPRNTNPPYTRTSKNLNDIVSELMSDYQKLVDKAKSNGLDIRYAPNADHTLELYFHDDYPDTLLVDKEISCKPRGE